MQYTTGIGLQYILYQLKTYHSPDAVIFLCLLSIWPLAAEAAATVIIYNKAALYLYTKGANKPQVYIMYMYRFVGV